jgi:anti-anti-sigma factor
VSNPKPAGTIRKKEKGNPAPAAVRKIQAKACGEYQFFHIIERFESADEIDDLRRQVQESITQGFRYLVFDFHDVMVVNSTVLAILGSAYAKIQKAGGELFILTDNFFIREILRITHLHDVIRVFMDQDEFSAWLKEEGREAGF